MFPAGRRTCVALLIVAIATYGYDCAGMTKPEQAMQCCKSMRCMSHHHHKNQDCCKTMPNTQVVIGQPVSASPGFTHAAFGLMQTFDESPSHSASARLITDQSHAPPNISSPAVVALRI